VGHPAFSSYGSSYEGKPLKITAFHCTNRKIKRFSTIMAGGGIYLSPDYPDWCHGAISYRCTVSLQNALFTDDRRLVQHSDTDRAEYLRGHGYDGLVYIEDGKILEIVSLDAALVSILRSDTRETFQAA